jgi:hypothetical protein
MTAVLAETSIRGQQKKIAPFHVGAGPRFFLFLVFFGLVTKIRPADSPDPQTQDSEFVCIFRVVEIVISLSSILSYCHLDESRAITIRACAAGFTRPTADPADGSSARGANPFRRPAAAEGGNWTSANRIG